MHCGCLWYWIAILYVKIVSRACWSMQPSIARCLCSEQPLRQKCLSGMFPIQFQTHSYHTPVNWMPPCVLVHYFTDISCFSQTYLVVRCGCTDVRQFDCLMMRSLLCGLCLFRRLFSKSIIIGISSQPHPPQTGDLQPLFFSVCWDMVDFQARQSSRYHSFSAARRLKL